MLYRPAGFNGLRQPDANVYIGNLQPLPEDLRERIGSQKPLYSETLQGLDAFVDMPLPLGQRNDIPEEIRPTVQVLEELILQRDPQYTYAHSVRVSLLAPYIAERLGCCTKKGLQYLRIGGRLHDLGKAIDVEVLRAVYAGKEEMTSSVFETLERHPEEGYRYVSQLSLPDAVKAIIANHHWYKVLGPYRAADCKTEGYEYLEQIIAAVDMYDSLRSERHYNEEILSIEETIRIMRDQLRVDERIIGMTDIVAHEGRRRSKIIEMRLGSTARQHAAA